MSATDNFRPRRITSLERQAVRRGVRWPSDRTLAKYGLTADEWILLLKNQGWVCPPCERGGNLVWNTDHDHVPKWALHTPEERRRHVRGVLCAHCNHRRVNSRMSAAEALRIAKYLAAYEARRDA